MAPSLYSSAPVVAPAKSEIMCTGTVFGLGRLPSKNALLMQASFVLLAVGRLAIPYGWLIVLAFVAIS